MRRIVHISLLIWGSFSIVNAQKYDIKGIIADSIGTPLISATVMLQNAKDSVLINFGLTDGKGFFQFKGLRKADYLLQISYLGYENKTLTIDLPESSGIIDLQMIRLEPQIEALEEVIVKSERVPLQIKKDTIEFNADAFQTRPNAVVEDLLKKLPGVEVERDGTIRAQGEQVRRVTVDGKEFFGTDPKMATKNLPADAVDKVQVFDKKSDMAEFSGIDDGQRQKTINLELKEDKKQGYFGSITAGGGTVERYEGKASINRFTPKQQISFIGMANNTNQQGFSLTDYLNFSGGLQRMMGSGGGRLELNANELGLPLGLDPQNGFTTTWAGGINFNSELSEKSDLNTSYFFNRMDTEVERKNRRENFLSDRSFLSEQDGIQNNLNTNHRLNFTLEQEIDSFQSIRLRSGFGYTETEWNTSNFSKAFSENGILENQSLRENTSTGENLNINANLLYRKKFRKKGRFFSANFDFGLLDNEDEGKLNAINDFFNLGGGANTTKSDTLQQENLQEFRRQNLGFGLSFTEKIGKGKYLELNYGWQRRSDEVNREVFDLFGPTDNNRQFNELLSNQYESAYTYNRGGINFRLNKKKYNFSTGLSLQHSQLNGKLLLSEIDINNSFVNVLPNLRMQFNFATGRNLRFRYETSVREPSIEQLQPVVDNSSPLNIYVGNPDLRPEYTHDFTLNYLSFNQLTLANFFGFFNFRYTRNKISESQLIDDRFVITRTPVNVVRDYNLNGSFSYSTPVRLIKSRINIRTDLFYVNGISLVNAVENNTNRLNASIDLRLENRFKETIDVSIGAKYGYNQTTYSIDDNLDQQFWNQTYYTDLSLNLPKGFTLSTNFDFEIFNGRASGFNQNVPLWHAAISKFVFKDQRGELKFSVFDLLNQNIGITRRAEVNFVEDVRIKSLGRYFMLSFTYTLKGLGGVGGSGIKVEHR